MGRNELRLREVLADIDGLRGSIDGWLAERQAPQYRSQFLALGDVVTGTLSWLREQVDGIAPGQEAGWVYEQCRLADHRLTFVRRLWSWYRQKFDQRQDTGALGDTLGAADEVVWSCYSQGFQATERPPGPVPLPYIEPLFSAYVTPRIEPPRDLQAAGDELLWKHLSQMPVPAIGLPPSCVERPWMLIFLVHETGHHLQYDLAAGLMKSFQHDLESLAIAAGGSPDQAKQWKTWATEVFADTFAIMAAGSWVARAMDELQLSGPVGMVTGAYGYPPPIVRTALNKAVVQLAHNPSQTLAEDATALSTLSELELPPESEDLRLRAQGHLELLPRLVPAIAAHVLHGDEGVSVPTLRQLGGWKDAYFSDEGDVHYWRDRLRGDSDLVSSSTRQAARLCAAGAVAAWAGLATADEKDLEKAEERLRRRIVGQLIQCRDGGDRAAGGPLADTRVLRASLIETLAGARPEALF
jgi:hypothetical protein